MKQNKLAVRWAAMMLLAGAFTGCKSTDTAHVGSMASVEIAGHSLAEVRQTTIDVFQANGFMKKSGLTFEKQGSNWDTAAYGAWSGNPVWIRMRVSVTPRGNNVCVIGCDAYIVRDHGEGFMEEEQKLKMSKRGDCQKILEQIRATLNPGMPAPGSGK